MAKFDCPPRFIATVRQFHDEMQVRMQNDGEFSEPFEVTNGIKKDTNTVQHDVFCHPHWCFSGHILVFQSGTVSMAIIKP